MKENPASVKKFRENCLMEFQILKHLPDGNAMPGFYLVPLWRNYYNSEYYTSPEIDVTVSGWRKGDLVAKHKLVKKIPSAPMKVLDVTSPYYEKFIIIKDYMWDDDDKDIVYSIQIKGRDKNFRGWIKQKSLLDYNNVSDNII